MTRASQKIAFKDKIAYIILKQRICCLHKKRIMAEINKTEDQKLEQKLAQGWSSRAAMLEMKKEDFLGSKETPIWMTLVRYLIYKNYQ